MVERTYVCTRARRGVHRAGQPSRPPNPESKPKRQGSSSLANGDAVVTHLETIELRRDAVA